MTIITTTLSPTISSSTPLRRQRCEVWTRVMGYHRPVTSFNPGKLSEYQERLFFKESPDSSWANATQTAIQP